MQKTYTHVHVLPVNCAVSVHLNMSYTHLDADVSHDWNECLYLWISELKDDICTLEGAGH